LDPVSLIALVALGIVTGFLAGLLGIGGGMVIVPFMAIVLDRLGFDRDLVLKLAIATSLTTILFTSLSSVRAHHRRGAVRWDIVRTLAPGIVIGSMAAAQIVRFLPSRWIALFFGAFIAYTALGMLRRRTPQPGDAPGKPLPGAAGMFGAGGAIGALSAFLGAGGGFLTVPFLSGRQVRIHQAVATSAACGFPIALAGTIGYVIAGHGLAMPAYTVGFIYLPGLAAVASASVLTAPLGARAAHALPVDTMRRLFACVLFGLAAYMFWRARG
jgi:uncharacterized membrane protein YfcA